ncbi:MAG: hypothetical protein HYY06_00015 [Deltaproteobacteria bacterium]|nr:hypothetical protein [Deltaproteobacteria bacterium]
MRAASRWKVVSLVGRSLLALLAAFAIFHSTGCDASLSARGSDAGLDPARDAAGADGAVDDDEPLADAGGPRRDGGDAAADGGEPAPDGGSTDLCEVEPGQGPDGTIPSVDDPRTAKEIYDELFQQYLPDHEDFGWEDAEWITVDWVESLHFPTPPAGRSRRSTGPRRPSTSV